MFDREAFKGKAVIVTGAARNIGEATARAFAGHGADVVLVDINIEAAERIAAELRDLGTRSFAVQADVTKAEEVQRAVDNCVERLGRVDVLANVAGGWTEKRAVVDTPDGEWDALFDLNLKSAFLMCRAVLPHMIARRSGRIINVSTRGALSTPYLTHPAYASAKAGVLAFTRHLSREVGAYGITVNVTAPGAVVGPRFRQLHGEARIEEMRKGMPLGRMLDPDDQADAMLFLAGDAARNITGVTLPVEGGTMA